MANDTKIRLGELVVVENTGRRHRFSSEDYLAVYVQVGGDAVPLLMTHREFEVIRGRSLANPEDVPEIRKRFMDRFRRKR
jgi:hypothetical protein|tara:strand:+ start:253 stop:492 length:240 start_codon:yes stop_codon:yes gene_type:complete